MKHVLFPLDAKFNRVLGMLSILLSNRGRLKLADLARISKSHIDDLLPDANAAEMLGLVRVSGGYMTLTRLGIKLHEGSTPSVKREVSKKLKDVEPFKTAYEIASKDGYFVSDDVAKQVAEKGFLLHTDSRKTRTMIDTALLQWGITFGVISYNGKERVWGKAD